MPDYTANISYPQEVCQQSKCRSFVHINQNFIFVKVHNAHKKISGLPYPADRFRILWNYLFSLPLSASVPFTAVSDAGCSASAGSVEGSSAASVSA